MAYLQLKSTNPNFSYILRKNPQSGMQIKPNRKGMLFAWYTNSELFNIYFRDSDTEVSFGKEVFEYIYETRYNTPLFLVNAFSEFLNHMKKPDDKDVVGYENILMINQIKCKPRSLEVFKDNFSDYIIEYEEVSFHNYRVRITTKKTIQKLVCLGQILSIFNSLLNDNLEYTSTNEIDKYMNWIQIVDAPYYIRHLFKIYFLKNDKLFNKYKPLLETTMRENLKMEFEFGGTLKQRTRAIKKLLDYKSNIIDIGCGEGNYIKEIAPKLDENVEYHAIDTDPESIEKVKRMCEKKGIENVAVWSSLDEFLGGTSCSLNNSVILLTEVMEHMTKDEASNLILKILNMPHQKVIITTPNKEFNQNYKIFEDDVRNEDHKFEMVRDEFVNFIVEIVNKVTNKNVSFFEIGDTVNGLKPTLAAVIT